MLRVTQSIDTTVYRSLTSCHSVLTEYGFSRMFSGCSQKAWEQGLHKAGLPEHLIHHLVTMAALHRAGRYDRMADGVERVTGRPAMSVRDFVALHAEEFGGRRS
jgi:hypothetical protein